MPVVASAIIWLWMLNGEFGIINHFLERDQLRRLPEDLLARRAQATRCRRWSW